MVGATFLERNVDLAQPVHEQDEVGAKRAIDQQFAAPMAVRALLPQKILLRPRDRVRNFRVSR